MGCNACKQSPTLIDRPDLFKDTGKENAAPMLIEINKQSSVRLEGRVSKPKVTRADLKNEKIFLFFLTKRGLKA